MPSSPPRTPDFRPDIQGLRAVAVGSVVLDHAGFGWMSGGFVGVDAFFVISGYLITSHLVNSLRRDGRIGFAGFYARRARRILPASFVVLAATVVGAMLWVPVTLRERTLHDAVATALYAPNYVLAARGTDYLADDTPSVLQHYWSLGVEEQFYLFWPALLALVWWLASRLRPRARRGTLAVAIAAVCVVSFAISYTLTRTNQPWAFFSLWTRAWELGTGALLAVVAPLVVKALRPWLAVVLGWVGLAALVYACVGLDHATVFPGRAALLPVGGTVLVIGAGLARPRFGPELLLGLRPMQFVGAVSYSLYLVHWPILQLPAARRGYDPPISTRGNVVLIAVSLLAAWLLYRIVENPVRRAPILARARPARSLVAALAGSAILVGGSYALVPLARHQADDLASHQVAAALPRAVAPPKATGFVPRDMTPTLGAGKDDQAPVIGNGCEVTRGNSTPHPCRFGRTDGPTMVLFGDSVGAAWQPAVAGAADALGYQLITQTANSCAPGLLHHLENNQPLNSCDHWRDNVVAQLRADPPDVLVLGQYGDEQIQATDVPPAQQWVNGMTALLARIPAQTKVVILQSPPKQKGSPLTCLARHVDDAAQCATARAQALDLPGRDGQQQIAKAMPDRVTMIDLTDYFCGTESCPLISGNVLMWIDNHHISATYSRLLAPVLTDALRAVVR